MVATGLSLLLLSGLVTAQITFPVSTQTSFPAPACTGRVGSIIERFTINYNFESVERGNPATAITEIGEYNLLSFNNINFVNTDPDKDGNHLGVAPHTYPFAAAFGAGVNSVTGTKPEITAQYIESTLTTFTPRSFWYGCVLPSPVSAGSLPVACNFTATGYSQSGHKLASQSFSFATNGSVVQDQKFAIFRGFNNIYSLDFQVKPLAEATVVIDNFIATLEQKACSPYYTGSYENGT